MQQFNTFWSGDFMLSLIFHINMRAAMLKWEFLYVLREYELVITLYLAVFKLDLEKY